MSGVVIAGLSLSTPLPDRAEPAVGADGAVVDVPGDADDAAGGAGHGDAAQGAEASGAGEPSPQSVAPATDASDAAQPDDPQTDDPQTGDPQTGGAETEDTGSAAPATNVPLPSGSEFNRPPTEEAAVLPALDTAPNAASPTAPQANGVQSAPRFDTSPAAQPEVSSAAPSGIATAPALGDQPQAPAGAASGASDAPVQEATPVSLSQPSASETPEVQTTPAPAPASEPAPDPEVEDAAAAENAAEPVAGDAAADPVDGPTGATTPPAEALAELDDTEPQTPALQVPRLPTIGGDAGGLGADPPLAPRIPQASRLPQNLSDDMGGAAAVPDPEPVPEPSGDLPAIEAFAAPFDASETRPLLAVILIDEPDSPIELSTLTGLSFPVAFAVDALHPDAADRAQAYRAAGFEVVMLGSMLVDGATARDTEVAVGAARVVVPEAVALLDTPDHRIQGDRPVLDATVAMLAETGQGLVAFPRGLNAAEQSALRAGVPGATVFRMLDDADDTAPRITRALTRAAFTAAQEGGVVVVGHTRPDTVTALVSWALSDRSEAVALAPLSAVLLRDGAN
ncbi:divergent polysaccharide deacetylase family protein [Gymnodinialimonas ulvae]|uniref:divergent polysaccharide deacetylase family protein n=1 Tax=Gymnodinialimonas ulvae TaxID=3126504 RepID=UPI003094B0E7